jgi:hypothetical protein
MKIAGADDLIKLFGHWPSFHDAKVVRFVLDRSDASKSGPSILAQVHTFAVTDEVGGDGAYVLKNHTLVSFRFLR